MLKKIKALIKLLIYLSLSPLVYLISFIKPIKLIKFAPMGSQSFGVFLSEVEGFFYNKKNNKELSKGKIIFFLGPLISNKQSIIMSKRLLNILPYMRILQVLCKAFKFFNKEEHILNLDKSSFYSSFHLTKNNIKPHIYFTEKELEYGSKLLIEMGISKSNNIVCVSNRDSLYLDKASPGKWSSKFNSWSYHNHRDFPVQTLELASDLFTKKGFHVLRMGKFVKEKLYLKNPKVIDYANSRYKSDFMDIYLPSKCKFSLCGDGGLALIPYIFNKPVYGINFSSTMLWEKNRPYLSLFIFKRIKNLENGKKFSIKEILKSNFAFAGTANIFDENRAKPIDNTAKEIEIFASEIDKHINGEEVFDKEDLKIQKDFWDTYIKYSNKNEIDPIMYKKISPSFLKNNIDLLS